MAKKIKDKGVAAVEWALKGAAGRATEDEALRTLYVSGCRIKGTNGGVIYGADFPAPAELTTSCRVEDVKGYLGFAKSDGFDPVIFADAMGVHAVVPGRDDAILPARADALRMPYPLLCGGTSRGPLGAWKTARKMLKAAVAYAPAHDGDTPALAGVRWGEDGVITAGGADAVYQGWCGDALFGSPLVLSVPLAKAVAAVSDNPAEWLCNGRWLRVMWEDSRWIQGPVTDAAAFDALLDTARIFSGADGRKFRGTAFPKIKALGWLAYDGAGATLVRDTGAEAMRGDFGPEKFMVRSEIFSRLDGTREISVDAAAGMLWWRTDIERGACIIMPPDVALDVDGLDEEINAAAGPEGL